MFAAQKIWSLDPFPGQDSDLVINLVKYGQTLGEKCFALLEGKETATERTYIGFGEGWVLTQENFPKITAQALSPDPLIHLRYFRKANFPNIMDLESGIIGYLDYEWGILWQKPKTTSKTPGYFFRLCPINIVIIPHTQKIVLEVYSQDKKQLEKDFNYWVENLNQFFNKESRDFNPSDPFISPTLEKPKLTVHSPNWQPNMSREEFINKVEKIKEYIRAGEISQAVFSQRFTLKKQIDPWEAYQKLREINPSPWLFCIFGDAETLVGSSPELLLSSISRKIRTRPIAGTRPRGQTSTEDKIREKELISDTKEMTEHAMLVDLGQKDISRVSKFGSVKVSEYANVQYFSHVMHIVSTVEGEIDTSYDSLDALKAVFPAGTLSGAPKIRAMEIIQESETCPREAYGGALGIVRWNDDIDFCITIRTLIIKQKEVIVQAGAGIVSDSVPEREYEETLLKAKALFTVIESSLEKRP